MSKTSKKLARAMIEGAVTVMNSTAGEVVVWIPTPDGDEKQVLVPAYGKAELAPKHTDASLLKRSRNLPALLRKGALRVQ